ncbi:hypothetical protein Tco_1275748 [Tanacetum coccineum]
MERQGNQKRRDVEFNIGDMMLVKLQLYRQVTLAKRYSNKLAKRYYGPLKVLERVGKEQVANLPEDEHEGQPVEQPLAICDTRIVLQIGIPVRQVLMQWSGIPPEEATKKITLAVLGYPQQLAKLLQIEGPPPESVALPPIVELVKKLAQAPLYSATYRHRAADSVRINCLKHQLCSSHEHPYNTQSQTPLKTFVMVLTWFVDDVDIGIERWPYSTFASQGLDEFARLHLYLKAKYPEPVCIAV